MIDLVRRELAETTPLWVVKIGTRPLTDPRGHLDEARVAALAGELHALRAAGRQVVLVSSGAVAAGMGLLGLSRRPSDLARLQAVAAVGQSYLVQAYERALRALGRHAAQILLTADDVLDRQRYLNVRNTILALLEMGAVPIINENDTVSVDELRATLGDNDRLAACVTNLLRAPLLVLLSDVDGLYDRDPRDPAAHLITTVDTVDDSIMNLALDAATGLSKGGMASKLRAARMATTAGENVIIANGRRAAVLSEIAAGRPVGTLFLAGRQAVAARKRWIGLTIEPRGHVVVDDGARAALVAGGKSLLPIGIRQVIGTFDKGEVIGVCDLGGREFARGLTNYASDDLQRIKGLRSDAVSETLGQRGYDEAIHRDHLAVLEER